MARNKIHKVTINGADFFIYADTRQGAVRDVLAHLKETASCEFASGQDMFYLGTIGGKILNEPVVEDDRQKLLDI